MNNEILWLVRLGRDQKLFTRDQALATFRAAGPGAELMDFAQKLIDESIVQDVEALENLAGQAMSKAQLGPPPGNPLLDEDTAPAAAARPTVPTAATTVAAPRAAPAAGVPQFPFDKVASLEDAALATAVRKLLISTGEFGASDLHLSAGSSPFVRKHRMLVPLTNHVLTEKESLRMNTALLAAHQRDIFLDRRDYDFALALDADHRYRVNLMFHKSGPAGCYRMVPAVTPSDTSTV